MKLNVLLFGSLAEKAGSNQLTLSPMPDLNAVRQEMETRFPFLKEMKYLVAVEQEVVKDNIELQGSEEIAIMPPFAGG